MLHSHFHCNLLVWVVAYEFKVFNSIVVNVLLALYPQNLRDTNRSRDEVQWHIHKCLRSVCITAAGATSMYSTATLQGGDADRKWFQAISDLLLERLYMICIHMSITHGQDELCWLQITDLQYMQHCQFSMSRYIMACTRLTWTDPRDP